MFEREEEIFIELLRFLARLFEETLTLHAWVIQLGITGRNFLAVDDQFVNVHERVILRILFRERYQLFWAMGHEKWVKGLLFDQFFEHMLGDFEVRHLRLNFDAELVTLGAASFTR